MGMHGASFPFPLSKIRSENRQVSDSVRRTANRTAQITGQAAATDAGVLSRDHPQIAGFRHFIADPAPGQRFKINGKDPLDPDPDNHKRLQTLMWRLATRMGTTLLDPVEDSKIPAGYTYLLQLVAHDLVQTSAPVSIIEDTTTGTHNARKSALRLDTIYGGGPLVCPFAYALDDDKDTTRTKLRLMSFNPDPGVGDSRFRDIARAAPTGMNGANRDFLFTEGTKRKRRPTLTDPLIPDPRNDSHIILSQMTALFHLLHNAICDRLLPEREELVNAKSLWEAAHERYVCARGATTLVYRNVVRKDLLKQILHPKIHEAYETNNSALLDAAPAVRSGWTMPLEFSHGAFRFGHAMIRDRYRLNDLLGEEAALLELIERTSAKVPLQTPLAANWLVRWSKFFDLKSMPPAKRSRLIGPKFNALLSNGKAFPPITNPPSGLPAGPDGFSAGLAYRDLMSAALVGLWSVGALIAEIRRRRPDFIALSPLLDKEEHREEKLREWLTGPGPASGLDNDDVNTLATDPPLPFFILFEAAHEPEANGTRLGTLGSILVADVMFRALREDPLPAETGAPGLGVALAKLSKTVYGDPKYLAGVRHPDGEINSMSRLIEFTAKLAGLENSDPPFL